MTIENCPKCKDLIYTTDKHKCNMFTVWIPEDGENTPADGRILYAFDEEDAAERRITHRDSYAYDYSVINGEIVEVFVCRPDTPNTTKRFSVSGETVPAYYVREIDDDKEA